MVLKNRLNYGFIGYQVPPVPQATRSTRRRGSFWKKVDDNQICPIELLVNAAGILERESSPSSSNTLTGKELTIVKDSVKKEQLDEDDPSKAATCDQERCDRGFFASKLVSQTSVQNQSSGESSHAHNDDCSGLASVITSDCSEKVISAEKLVDAKKRKIRLESFGNKVKVASSGYVEYCDYILEDESKKQIKREVLKNRNASISMKPDICSLDNMEVQDWKPTARVSVDNSLKFPLSTDHIHSGSFPARRDDVKLVFRDDDENSSGYVQPSTTTKAFWSPPRSCNRRIRKLLASKYWKLNHKLKGKECFTAETKPVYHYRKNCYRRQRSQRDYPLKKKKLYHRSWVTNPDGGSSGDVRSPPGMKFSCDASGLDSKMHGASGTSTCVAGQDTPSQARESHVKLRIKSFKVPELFIEIPETASVGSLKRMVMEAVTAILGGGLQVGVLLQGKNIRDDNKSLLETGISCDEKLDALGFTLEPNPSQAPSPLCEKDHHLLLACNTPQPLTRYTPPPTVAHNVVHQRTGDALPDPPVTNLGNFIESDHDLAPSPSDMSLDKSPVDCRALVAIPAMKVEALTTVPMRKSKRSEAMQRRIRRPFSVSEVEALVQAVEKLGTGRWRDVKLRAFDDSKHRTYVDLKDKWKTLVHTARISPQQRRGEPVPQELLDRVLTAHAYWSQHQAKQQHKHQSETCLLQL